MKTVIYRGQKYTVNDFVQYIATDQDGSIYGYSEGVQLNSRGWTAIKMRVQIQPLRSATRFTADWRSSLRHIDDLEEVKITMVPKPMKTVMLDGQPLVVPQNIRYLTTVQAYGKFWVEGYKVHPEKQVVERTGSFLDCNLRRVKPSFMIEVESIAEHGRIIKVR